MTPSLYLCFIVRKESSISNKDIGMVSCSFVHLCCNDPLFLRFWCFKPSLYPLHFEEMIFPLVEKQMKICNESCLRMGNGSGDKDGIVKRSRASRNIICGIKSEESKESNAC